jgi:toxin ParE1/3/4
MTYHLDILSLAAEDMHAAKNYFNRLRHGLGDDFGLCLEEALERMRRNPVIYAPVRSEFRRVLIHRFPYAIYFRTDSKQIKVYGVFHNRQNTDTWHQRAP